MRTFIAAPGILVMRVRSLAATPGPPQLESAIVHTDVIVWLLVNEALALVVGGAGLSAGAVLADGLLGTVVVSVAVPVPLALLVRLSFNVPLGMSVRPRNGAMNAAGVSPRNAQMIRITPTPMLVKLMVLKLLFIS